MKAFNAVNSLFWLKAGDYQVMNKADDTNSLVYLYRERLDGQPLLQLLSLIIYRSNGTKILSICFAVLPVWANKAIWAVDALRLVQP